MSLTRRQFAIMLVYMSQYVDEHSAAPSAVSIKSPPKPASSKSRKDKINFVSKASLAMFDPRLAMGIDAGSDWYEPDSHVSVSSSSLGHAAHDCIARHSEDNARAHHWNTSPTPELEAFAAASIDDYSYSSSSAHANVDMARQPSASSSVFEDDRDVPETSSRRRFLSRKSVAPASTAIPPNDMLFSPLETKSKSNRGATAASTSSASSFSRFFSRRKKDKAPHLAGLASRSTPDLFDGVPQSAPPTTMTFEQSGFTFSPPRNTSDSSSLDDSPSSLPTSPEHQPILLLKEFNPVRTSPLNAKQSMPALRQIREAHNAAGACQPRSIAFASPETRLRSVAAAISDSFDTAPALPPLPSFDSCSPMIPPEFAWDSKRTMAHESRMTSTASNARPVSRVVSSTGRGVPSPSLNPIRLNDSRKSVALPRSEAAVRFAGNVKPAPVKSTVTRPAAEPTRADKRLSMTQSVVDGLLDQNHGREEPEMRTRRTDMEVRSARRRSRSVDSRTLPCLTQNHVVSPPSSKSHSDSVFPAFVRHAPVSPGRANSPHSHLSAEAESANAVTPTPRQRSSFKTPTSASPSMPPAHSAVRGQSPSSRSPQRQASGETHQARRVNFAGQRVKAVAVASPLLLSKSPRLGGRSGASLPVVNIMPPTPDLTGTEQDQEHQQAVLQQQPRQNTVVQQTVAQASVVAAVPSSNFTKVVTSGSSQNKAQTAPVERTLPSRQGATTPTPKHVAAAPVKPVQPAPVTVMSPKSVYSPVSVYSPETGDRMMSFLHGVLTGDEDDMSKEEMQITADSVAAEMSYISITRNDSVTSELSEASSARSSCSGAFAFSRSMSNASLVSGGTFSSASSNASESPERRMRSLFSKTSFDFSPTKMSSCASLASTAGSDVLEMVDKLQTSTTAKADPSEAWISDKLKMPFQLKRLSVDADSASPAAADSSDCETPTLASCRQMDAASVQPRDKAQQDRIKANRQLGLSMDLNDLAQELGLGRLSQLGLSHLKGVESLAQVPGGEPSIMPDVAKKMQPIKPPKSSARAAATAAVGGGAAAPHFGMGMKDIASSAAMSPLPVSIAGRSPQTPPRKQLPQVEPAAGCKVSASGVPKSDGGFGLGLKFFESPSPQSEPSKAAIAPTRYGQHVLEQSHTVPTQLLEQQQALSYHYEQHDEVDWVGVAM